MVVRHAETCRWEGVDLHPYKEDGSLFKSVTRQTLAKGTVNLPVELRYFEVGVGGHSTLERHDHSHLVTIVQGSGHVLIGDEVHELSMLDVVQIPPMTWHQFQATQSEVLGFLCVVREERDRPQRPTPEQLQELRQCDSVAAFIKF
jgi:quercetin dioxygenase-like cupin family protein